MIGYLFGTVKDISAKRILVLTSGGVGYEVLPSGSLLASCKEDGEFSAEIFTVVREQEITLYGFGSADEKTLFEKLIAVSGIGPKTAKDIVSTPVELFLKAVEEGDTTFITKLPGIGKKTAERLIIELRGKIDLSKKSADFSAVSPAMQEASEALESLGYDKNTIASSLQKAPENLSTEGLVKYFLSQG